ncbi:MAG: acetate--CoA ligase family protein, partial [Vicinamibacterales bacterium]|nr:acetate--CoA ligase family protein [Vicinamibacterales bacterium]
ASVANPVDMVASAGPAEYGVAIETVVTSSDTDALIVIFTPVDPSCSDQIVTGIQDGIARARAAGASNKPILACVMADAHVPLRAGAERIPTYTFPENAVRALGKVTAYSTWRSQPAGLFWGFDDINLDEARAICRKALADRGDTWLTDKEAWAVLHAFAMPAAVRSLARTADDAAAFASVIGFPVAAKLASTKVQHKTELGVVRLNLMTPQEVREAFADIVARGTQAVGPGAIEGVVIQPMISGGVETIVGIAHDPVFGPLVAFGIGGVNVEVFGDVRFRVAPLADRDADDLLHEIRGLPLLKGHRGRAPADMEALRDVLLRVSRLAEEVPEISELDLNPVIALAPGNGCRIVDARIRVATEQRPASR